MRKGSAQHRPSALVNWSLGPFGTVPCSRAEPSTSELTHAKGQCEAFAAVSNQCNNQPEPLVASLLGLLGPSQPPISDRSHR